MEPTPKQTALDSLSNIAQQRAAAAVPYETYAKSYAKRMDTVIPGNLAFETGRALTNFTRVLGDMDAYVAYKLGYADKQDMLSTGLGAEQVDFIGQAIDQIDRGQGIIAAHQTGVGKGLLAAAVLMYAIKNNIPVLFFTEKPGLFSKMFTELQRLRYDDVVPLVMNTGENGEIIGPDGETLFKGMTAEAQQMMLTNWIEYGDQRRLPASPVPNRRYDCVFCTYSQLNTSTEEKGKKGDGGIGNKLSLKQQFIQRYAQDAILILDESHNAGGFDSNIGKFMRHLLQYGQGALFLSATFAKNPTVMPLYATRTGLGKMGVASDALADVFVQGGLALQELAASMLAESGQMVRVQRTFDNIKTLYETIDDPLIVERANVVIGIMSRIADIDEQFVQPRLRQISEVEREAARSAEKTVKDVGVNKSPFFSRIFNIVDQLLFSLKAPYIARRAIEILNTDPKDTDYNRHKKVVIAFRSTMESLIDDADLGPGDVLTPEMDDFARSLRKSFDNIFKYTLKNQNGEKSDHVLDWDELASPGPALCEVLLDDIDKASSGLSISPIDDIIRIIEAAKRAPGVPGSAPNYRVAEVTGRKKQARLVNGEKTFFRYRSDAKRLFKDFNAGVYDVLLINQSGSTGEDAHASREFKDQRQRVMIIHQAELDINTEVQKRGRVNRTGQVCPPEYLYMTTIIPAEQRLLLMLKGKMKALDANTSGNQQNSEDQLKVAADFFNKYGDQVAIEYMQEDEEMDTRLGRPFIRKGSWTDPKEINSEGKKVVPEFVEDTEDAVNKCVRKAALLTVEFQQVFYDELTRRYNELEATLKARNMWDLETQFLPLNAEIKERRTLSDSTGDSQFEQGYAINKCTVDNLRKPLTRAEVEEIIAKTVNGKSPEQYKQDIVAEVNAGISAAREKALKPLAFRLKRIEEEKADIMVERTELRKRADALRGTEDFDPKELRALEKENAVLIRDFEKLEKEQKAKDLQLIQIRKNSAEFEERFNRMSNFVPGQVVKVPLEGADLITAMNNGKANYGVFVGYNIKTQNKNPYVPTGVSMIFATTDDRRTMEFVFSDKSKEPLPSMVQAVSATLTDYDRADAWRRWDELIREASASRVTRYIIMGNMVKSLSQFKGRVVKFNIQATGENHFGILLDKETGAEAWDKQGVTRGIGAASTQIYDLPIGRAFDIWDNKVLVMQFEKTGHDSMQVSMNKGRCRDYYQDPRIIEIVQDGYNKSVFEQGRAGMMEEIIPLRLLAPLLARLDEMGLQYTGEKAPAEQVQSTEDAGTGRFVYRMAASKDTPGSYYPQGVKGFEEYPGAPFGVVVYGRELGIQTRITFGLEPVWQTLEEPYLAWRERMATSPAVQQEYDAVLSRATALPTNEGIAIVSQFILRNTLQEGNFNFTFGQYSPQEVAAFMLSEDQQEISLSVLIQQLEIELSAY